MVRRTLIRALTLAGAVAGVVHAAEIDLGTDLPAVTALDQDGKSVDLKSEGGSGYTLVYFYPKADTSGCTKQACSLRDAYTDLSKKGIRVYGVSGDDVAAQKAFADKYNLPFRLLADPDSVVTNAFGVPRKGAYASRQAFLFKDGKLVWRDLTASTSEQAADVLAAIEELGKS
jgi:peroxiredoxin Q/BCP